MNAQTVKLIRLSGNWHEITRSTHKLSLLGRGGWFTVAPMNYWLMKSEPDDVSIDDLARLNTVGWYGVRNYQARNFMRDTQQIGDGVLFYHSSCELVGIAGIARVASKPYPDPTQFDPTSKYFDAKSSLEKPRWQQVDVEFVRKTRLLSLAELRQYPPLASMVVLQKGSRLSITPVTQSEWDFIQELLA